MWGIQFNGTPPRNGSFPFYRKKAEAERVAAEWRAMWPRHSYIVVRIGRA